MPALRLWRMSAISTWVIAAGFGLPTVPVAVYVLRRRQLPWFFDMFPMYGGPVDAWVGPTGYALLLLLFGVVAPAEAAVGVLLWRGKPAGAIWSLALLPVEIAFWIGFALPFPPMFAAVRLTLTLFAWSRTKRNSAPVATPRIIGHGCDPNVPLVDERPAETDPALKAAFEGAENWAAHHAEQLLADDDEHND